MPTKVHVIKAVFPVVMCGCESWTRKKKAERQRSDDFEWRCWRRLLRVPWTARRRNQSILKAISPEYSLEGLILKLRLQYFGHWCKEPTHWKRLRRWERLKAKGVEDDRGWDGWMASLTQWTWVWANSQSWWRTGKPGELQSAAAASLQSCPTLCDPINGSPPGSPVPGILQQEHWSGVPLPSPVLQSMGWQIVGQHGVTEQPPSVHT